MTHLLDIRGVSKDYGVLSRPLKVLNDINLKIAAGEVLGLVGESGSGKSTLGRIVLRLDTPTEGKVVFSGQDITHFSRTELRPVRRKLQAIFQDPYASLSPRMRVGAYVAEALPLDESLLRADYAKRLDELFVMVGLDPRFRDRFPHELSGGQRQRVCIARALAPRPELIVADEPITALDVSIQAQIINLFNDLKKRLGLAYLFIAHDLATVRYLSDRVAVMLDGRIVEVGPTASVFASPAHDYTRALLSAAPVPDPKIEKSRQRLIYRHVGFTGEEQMTEVSPGHFCLR